MSRIVNTVPTVVPNNTIVKPVQNGGENGPEGKITPTK